MSKLVEFCKMLSNNEIEPLNALFPSPVALVTSCDNSSRSNVCTVSWMGVVSTEPFQVGIVLRKSRLTYEAISQSLQFAINIPSTDLIHTIDYCGFISGRNRNKFTDCNLTTRKGRHVRSPLINECTVNYECTVASIINAGSHDLIIGKVVATHISHIINSNERSAIIDKVNPLILCFNEYWSIGKSVGKILII
ncbi:MAG: flavin reductase family protein [Nitrospirota bacterium]